MKNVDFSKQIKTACTVNGISYNPTDGLHNSHHFFVPITLISELSAVVKLDAADSALCTVAEGHYVS